MRTNLTALFMVLMLVQVSAQKNWITENFKTHLEKEKLHQFVEKGDQEIGKMSDKEKDESVYVMNLFKLMANYDDAMMPVCFFNEALLLVGIEVSSKEISKAVYLMHCKVGDSYYHFLYSTLGNVGVNVEVSKANKDNAEENIKLVGDAYSVTFIEKAKEKIDYEIVSFNMVQATGKSPCLG